MAHNTILTLGTTGDTMVTVDLSLATYPSATGKAPVSCIYVSANATTAPTACLPTNPLAIRLCGASGFSDAVTEASGTAIKTAVELLDDAVATVAAAVPTKGVAAAGTDGTNARLLKTDASGELQIDVLTLPALVAGTANIGDVDVLTVPADPFGLNADAASATGSISAKLRHLAATGIAGATSLPGGTNNIGDVDVLTLPSTTNAGATVKTSDFDTGVGTDTVTMFGLALPASGGAVAGGTSTNPVRTDPTGTTTQPVSGTVAVTGVATLSEQQTQTTALQLLDDVVATDGSAVVAKLLQVGGTDGTNAQTFSVDTAGRLNVNNVAGTVSLPTGASTLAEQQTQTTALQLIDNLVLIEDAAHVSGDSGVQMLAVRKDAGAAIAGTDGDYSPLQVDASGNLRVTGGGGGTQFAEDAVHATGDLGTMALGVRKDTATALAGLDGDYIPFIFDSTGRVHANVSNTVTVDTELPVAAALADAAGNPTTALIGGCLHVFNGTTWDRARGDTTNGLDVDVTRLPALVAGSANIGDVDVLTLPALVAGTANIGGVAGDVAHDGVNSGNPFQLGAEAIAHGTNPTAVAAGDRTKLYANRAGVLFFIGGHPNVQTFRLRWTAAQTDVALATVAAGLKIVVTSSTLTMDEATTVGVAVRVGFGAVTTPANTATSGVVLDHDGTIPGGGLHRGDGAGILGIGADGEDLRVTAEAPTTGSAIIYGSFYTVES